MTSDIITKLYLLIRVGNLETINKQYNEKYIEFGCPENWRNLAWKKPDCMIGDDLECVFAKLPQNNNEIYEKFPGFLSNPKQNGTSKTVFGENIFYRWNIFTQTPTLCFYSRDVRSEISSSSKGFVEYDLDDYCCEIGYFPEDSSYLIIHSPSLFLKELEEQMPIAIEEANKKGNIFPHEATRDLEKYLYGGYTKIYKLEELISSTDFDPDYPDILKKIQREGMPDFKKLHELRLYTIKYFFWQFDNHNGEYDYLKNTLKVYLPTLEKYAGVINGKQYSGIRASNFNFENNKYTITGILRKASPRIPYPPTA